MEGIDDEMEVIVGIEVGNVVRRRERWRVRVWEV